MEREGPSYMEQGLEAAAHDRDQQVPRFLAVLENWPQSSF